MDRLTSDREILTHGVGAVSRRRDIVRVFGADAESFLQTQVTQDVSGLAPGESRWSFILEPKGRVDAIVRVWGRLGGSEILLDVGEGAGQSVVDRLNRFRIRTKVELELFSWDCVALRGPQSETAAEEGFHSELRANSPWNAVLGVDLLGPSVVIPENIPELAPESLEALRVESGWPAMGHEFGEFVDPLPIPGEVGVGVVLAAVSFTKGCYTGQEIVVRTHSRGNNTPRRLRRLQIEGEPVPPVGSDIAFGGEVRGTLTSIAPALGGGQMGLGFIHRSVEENAVGVIEWDSGDPSGPHRSNVTLVESSDSAAGPAA
ncbi:MAG TPA: hypothetical protein VL068_15330, partial [Microthrixaceae bacterium]|nr:hypothetical protein [Microthrixaceae bacterium]